MSNDSLDDVKVRFKAWRLRKRYSTERIPADLLARAQRAVSVHGVTRVAEVTKVERRHLAEKRRRRRLGRSKKAMLPVPAFSRVEITAPTALSAPVAEAESPSGMKLRVFSITPETMGLVSSFCRTAGAV